MSFDEKKFLNEDGMRIIKEYIDNKNRKIQSDWSQQDENQDDYIKNKPQIKQGEISNSIVQGDSTSNWEADIYINNSVVEYIENETVNENGLKIQLDDNGKIIAGAFGSGASAFGTKAQALGGKSFAEGSKTIAFANNSHAEGNGTFAAGQHAHSEGNGTSALGNASHAEGQETDATGLGSHSEGLWSKAEGQGAHAEGEMTEASSNNSHAEGHLTKAKGNNSHAEGNYTEANGENSHTEGYLTKAFGNMSHAEGNETIASGNGSHSEGYLTKATEKGSHAEGTSAQATNEDAHAEGNNTLASGYRSHAEGFETVAKNTNSHAEGWKTITGGDNQHVQGKWNLEMNENYAHVVGNGDEKNPSNAHTLDWNGNAWFAGDVKIGANNDKLVSETEVDTKLAALVDSAPETLNTLNELANALGEDPNFATTITNELSKKVDKTILNEEIEKINDSIDEITIPLKDGEGSNSLVQGDTTSNWEANTDVNPIVADYILNEETNENGLKIQLDENGNVIAGAFGDNSASFGTKSQALGGKSFAEGSKTIAFENNSHTEGNGTFAAGKHSHAEGNGTSAIGSASHAEGQKTNAIGLSSHSEGLQSKAKGNYSHAEGSYTEANEENSHAEGRETKALSRNAHAEGEKTEAKGVNSHAEGSSTVAEGDGAHSEGYGTHANGGNSHAEGYFTQAIGLYSHAEGLETIAQGNTSHTEGQNTYAEELAAHAEGASTYAKGAYSHAEGYNTHAEGECAHTEGEGTYVIAPHGHAEGEITYVEGRGAHAEGYNTHANGWYSHAEGVKTQANEEATHAEGYNTIANGYHSHVQGKYNIIDTENKYAHIVGNGTNDDTRSNAHTLDWDGNAWFSGDVTVGSNNKKLITADETIGQKGEGYGAEIFNNIDNNNFAFGYYAHAEGYGTSASDDYSHAEGRSTKAQGKAAHAEGYETEAKGFYSHAEGRGTVAEGEMQHVEGQYNIVDTVSEGKYIHIAGNGTAPNNRSNAHTLDWNGNAWFSGNVTVGENNDKLLTEAEVNNKMDALINGAPGTLDTLNEIATALGNDPNFATTIINLLSDKVNKYDLSDVARDGDYNSLINKPEIETYYLEDMVNGSNLLTINGIKSLVEQKIPIKICSSNPMNMNLDWEGCIAYFYVDRYSPINSTFLFQQWQEEWYEEAQDKLHRWTQTIIDASGIRVREKTESAMGILPIHDWEWKPLNNYTPTIDTVANLIDNKLSQIPTGGGDGLTVVTEITEAATNSEKPTALAVKNYVDAAIGDVLEGSY